MSTTHSNFNTPKPWSTLKLNGEMLECELYENCQIHLAYMGKDQYTTLQCKPFIEQAVLLTVKSMLDPMKIQHINKETANMNPWTSVRILRGLQMRLLTQKTLIQPMILLRALHVMGNPIMTLAC